MRTFHTGGVATGALIENDIKSVNAGTIEHPPQLGQLLWVSAGDQQAGQLSIQSVEATNGQLVIVIQRCTPQATRRQMHKMGQMPHAFCTR